MRSLLQERFRDDDSGRAAVRSWAALEFCEWGVDHGGGEDLVEGVDVTELGVGVLGRVEVVDAGDLGKVGGSGVVSGGGRGRLVGWGCFLGDILGKEGREGELTSPCTPSLHFQTFAPRLVHW